MERICSVLQTNEIILHVARSSLDELDKLPKDNDIFVQARQFGLDECEIIENTDDKKDTGEEDEQSGESELSPSEDIINLVKDGNKHSYFIASQDKQLIDTLRGMVFVPLLWLTNGVLIFDKPSNASINASKRDERLKQKTGGGTMTPDEAELIQRLRREEKQKIQNERSVSLHQNGNTRKRKKAKQPNPLSCKKKKTDETKSTGEEPKKKRRRRKKTNESTDPL